MRKQVCTIVACLSVAVLAGCAQRDAAVTATPTADELPELAYLKPFIPANIIVEGRDHSAPLVQLVPDFSEPELTAEERAALGQDGPEYKFLLYGRPPFGPTVGPWYGGVTTLAGGRGGPSLGLVGPKTIAGAARANFGGVAIGIDPLGSHVAGVATGRRPAGIIAERGGVTVGEDRPSKIARHHTHRDQ